MTEAGHYTEKYDKTVEMIQTYDILADELIKPERPAIIPPVAYPTIQLEQFLNFEGILANVVSNNGEQLWVNRALCYIFKLSWLCKQTNVTSLVR